MTALPLLLRRLSSQLAAAAAALSLVACGSASPAAPAASSGPASSQPAGSAAQAPASASASPASAAASSKLTQVKVAFVGASAVQGPLFVGREQGFFAKQGLDVVLQQVKSTAQVPALMSNEVQFGAQGAAELVNADLAGSSMVMLASFSNYPIFSLYAQKQIKTVQDLKGKTVGVTGAGSSTDLTAHLFLKHYDLLNNVKILPAGTDVAAILASMQNGVIAAGILSPPSTAAAERAGFVELINGVKLGTPLVHSGLVATRAYVQSQPETVKRFLTAFQQSWAFCAAPANEAAVTKSLAEIAKSNVDLAKVSYTYLHPVWSSNKVPTVDPRGIQSALDLSEEPKAKTAKPEQFIDNSILESVAK